MCVLPFVMPEAVDDAFMVQLARQVLKVKAKVITYVFYVLSVCLEGF